MIARPSPLVPILVAAIAALHLLAAAPVPADEPALVIEGCSLFDPHSAAMQADRTILIRGQRIVAVVATGQPLDDIRNTRRIDAVIRAGKVVRPPDLLRLVPRQ